MDFAHKIYIFQADEYSGTVTELSRSYLQLRCIIILNVQSRSEEMRPQWFTIDADASENGIPYNKMWADDRSVIFQSSCHCSSQCVLMAFGLIRIWLRLLIHNTPFIGRADFGISPTGDKTGVDAPMTRTWFAKVTGF